MIINLGMTGGSSSSSGSTGGSGFTPTAAQTNAMNSGITRAKVTKYDGYETSKADKSDTYTKEEVQTLLEAVTGAGGEGGGMPVVMGLPEGGLIDPGKYYVLQISENTNIILNGGSDSEKAEEYHLLLNTNGLPSITWEGVVLWANGQPNFCDGIYEVSILMGMAILTPLLVYE